LILISHLSQLAVAYLQHAYNCNNLPRVTSASQNPPQADMELCLQHACAIGTIHNSLWWSA